MYFLTFYYFFIYQNPKSLCFSHSLQNSFIHAYLLNRRYNDVKQAFKQNPALLSSRENGTKQYNADLIKTITCN